MTKKKIGPSDIEAVARLARLGLSAEEKEKFGRQLNDVLLYMEKLDGLPLEGVEPLSHVLPLQNVMRDDTPRPGLEQKQALANAPEKRDGFFKVPPVIE
ncbi:MAG: Asp-tRNA(Asn)/Glu-tRNA(Gln) amidotransferase subunit GatC [Candidatus Erginobacter occultus]|nr:Asp-tRNA(Asn)/Glu-tRNA(Gln) amidotransferase subunit GatC [Candidatus Erginobacter occultus]